MRVDKICEQLSLAAMLATKLATLFATLLATLVATMLAALLTRFRHAFATLLPRFCHQARTIKPRTDPMYARPAGDAQYGNAAKKFARGAEPRAEVAV